MGGGLFAEVLDVGAEAGDIHIMNAAMKSKIKTENAVAVKHYLWDFLMRNRPEASLLYSFR